jgi:hypothetical protein
MERGPLTRGIAVGCALTVLAILMASAAALRQRAAKRSVPPPDTVATLAAPPNSRIRVEVLNATSTKGLARRATRFLRDQGFDVVDMGTAPEPADTIVVVDRSGHPEMAQKVADAFGGARMQMRPDTLRYVDVTVLIGRSWRPPPSTEPFNP